VQQAACSTHASLAKQQLHPDKASTALVPYVQADQKTHVLRAAALLQSPLETPHYFAPPLAPTPVPKIPYHAAAGLALVVMQLHASFANQQLY
jgi:hypothetical protein